MKFIIKCETHNHECLNVNQEERHKDILAYYFMHVKHENGCTLSYKWYDGEAVSDVDPNEVLYLSPEELEEKKQEYITRERDKAFNEMLDGDVQQSANSYKAKKQAIINATSLIEIRDICL